MATPVRVLYVSQVAAIGGAEVALLDLVRLVSRERVCPAVAVPGEGRLADELRRLGAAVHEIPPCRLKRTWNPIRLAIDAARVARSANALARIAERESIQLIHANGSSAGIAAAWATRRLGVPLIWHCRDMVRLPPPLRWAARRATRVVAISAAVARQLREEGIGERLRLIPNGVDTTAFAPMAGDDPLRLRVRAEWGLGPERIVVGMVANLVPWKRHDLFIEAVAQAAARDGRLSFVLVGEDLLGEHAGYRERLRQAAAARGIAERLTFAGGRRDMRATHAALDIVAHPADAEPFGRALAEAMACGRPVVAVNRAGPAEIVEHGVSGLLVPPGDADALAMAILSLAGDKAAAESLGRGARARIAERFEGARVARAVEALYAEVLATP